VVHFSGYGTTESRAFPATIALNLAFNGENHDPGVTSGPFRAKFPG
jgi:hypothetical protein